MKKQLQRAGLLFVFAAIFSSCTKNELIKDNALLKQNQIRVASAGDGQNDLLGYGYNVTGEYANSSASRYAVIDVARLKSEQPLRVEWDLSSKKYGDVISGENAYSFLMALTDKMGVGASVPDPSAPATTDPKGPPSIPLFKASIEASFENSNSFSSKFVYSNYALKIQQKRVKMNADVDLLKQYLTPTFITDIQNYSPQAIVSSYGTHVLKDIILGAKLDITYRAETKKTDRKDAATTGLDFNVLGIFSINTKNTTTTQQATDNTNQRITFKAIGGEPSSSLFGNIPLGSTLPTISTTQWENSSSLLNAEMIDIAEDGLIPIWTLISDPVKSLAVKNYIIQYLSDNRYKLTPDPVYNYWSAVTTHHLYTIDKNAYPYEQSGYAYNGIAFYAFVSQVPSTLPVYDYWSAGTTHHLYTIDKNAYPYEQSGYTYNGIAFYAFISQVPSTLPVYDYWSAGTTHHLYTIDKNAYPYEQSGYAYNGIAFYAYPN